MRHHLFKKKEKKEKPTSPAESFDPLVTDRSDPARKSTSTTKVVKFKNAEYIKEFDMQAEDWIMSAVMMNCVRRSNALHNYTSEELVYSDGKL